MEAMKVLLVDDHALFRSGIASLLGQQEDFEVIGEAGNGLEALEKAKELMPDLILMDIEMPECNGLEATRRIQEVLPYAKIVILTVSEEDHTLFEAIKAGAQGYLLKKIEPKELFDLLRGVSRGEAPISKATAAKILGEYAKQSHQTPSKRGLQETLTPREREVLERLTEGTTNKEIANALCISENTVKNHLRNILDKLHLQNRVQAVAYALREGLFQQSDDPSI
jgi:DNA-binding NarL/FixJ family response regulator